MSGGGSTSTIDPRVYDLLHANVNRASGVAATPFTPYTAPMTAGLSGNQQLASSYAPLSLSAGAPAVHSAIGGASDVMGFKPQNVSPTNVTAGTLPGTDLSGYMNPFQKGVTDTTLADMERQRQIQRVNDQQSGTAAGAFGGARSGVADALTNEAFQRTGASTLAGLNSANFNNAQGMATTDLNRALTAGQSNQGTALAAGQSNQGAGIQGAGLNLNAATATGALGGQQERTFQDFMNNLTQTGATAQSTEQAGLTAQMQEFMRQIGYGPEMQGLMNQSLGLFPGQSQQQKPDQTGAIVGGIGSAAAAAAMIF